MPRFYEFFAGGGMARAGLGEDWECLFANDFDYKKSITYRRNWGGDELLTADIRNVKLEDLPGRANLVWGSFPCQDLSLAGGGAGLKGDRSGTFWPFWDIVENLITDNRHPDIIVLENVVGTLHSHEGRDFTAICSAFQRAGYYFGAMIIDAALFVPQSRPRLFIIGMRSDLCAPPGHVCGQSPSMYWCSRTLLAAYGKLPERARRDWIWWDMPMPPQRTLTLTDLIEDNPDSVQWHTVAETEQLLAMMSDVNLTKVNAAKQITRKTGRRMVGAIYKRTRRDGNGTKIQRAEVRFDDVAGCLRTPAGGSSRQLILVVDGASARSRLITSRETARLMGLPDDYLLPENYNEAYHLTGDGVVVPVVRHIAQNILTPLMVAAVGQMRAAA
ncbi:MAG: DNA cytosine methyltransferase [Candidatus Accumulibacter sp.]|nr:DNA cytosine methyltransferase [Accumulibacter sp.]